MRWKRLNMAKKKGQHAQKGSPRNRQLAGRRERLGGSQNHGSVARWEPQPLANIATALSPKRDRCTPRISKSHSNSQPVRSLQLTQFLGYLSETFVTVKVAASEPTKDITKREAMTRETSAARQMLGKVPGVFMN